MSHFFNDPANCRVFVCESSTPVRKALMDALRACGYENLNSNANPKDMMAIVETEPVDWLITTLEPDDPVNGLHILRLLTEVPRLRKTRVSLMLRPGEESVLPLAFELGLLSYHDRSLPMIFEKEFKLLKMHLVQSKWNTTLTSAAFLRRYLRSNRLYKRLIAFEKSLLNLFPGSCDILLNIAEAEFLGGEHRRAIATLRQICLLGTAFEEKAQDLCRRYIQGAKDGGPVDLSIPDVANKSHRLQGDGLNALGIECCLIVDPDTTVQYSLENCLRQAGVPQVVCFPCGEQAFRWIEEGGKPDFVVQEWRLDGLSGPMFLQRLRKHGLISVPVIAISSLIKEGDTSLVQEMGVSAVVEKPFENQDLLKEIVWTLQQSKLPTEQISLEHKIRHLLEMGSIPEAIRLQAQYLADESFDKAGKLGILAEFAYYNGDFEKTRKLAFQALKMSRDSLPALNMLGKALLKLGDHDGALKCFAKAQTLSPKHIDRLCEIAAIELDLGQTEAAEQALATAKDLDAGNVSVKETEAKIAIVKNDVERAQEALGHLESLSRILSYMNNKAVALTRCSQFEEGIELYKSTLKALPGEWSLTHDLILYNLGLAHVRYAELEQAFTELQKIRSDEKSPLGIKVRSLQSRIEQSLKHGTAMILSEPATDSPGEDTSPDGVPGDGQGKLPGNAKGDGDGEIIDFDSFIGSIEAGPGDLCCYRIFFANELLQPEVVALIAKPPRFKERQSIDRQESMQVRQGG